MKVVFSLFIFSLIFFSCSTTKKQTVIKGGDQNIFNRIFEQNPFLSSIVLKPEHKVQIIYTQIDRRKNGRPEFTDHYFNINDSSYFYPASTVKLPVAILALQKLNELKIAGLDKNSTMISEADYSGQSEVYTNPSSPDGRPTI